ncbi:hypothetical protein M514_27469 [Trichuris suis]|uniref:Uncharacterized protein n=1 Tax=Trichuris suis TaxID=68888 RepID=A0A085MT13_9BILA|nr:hypothetical protein M514_27469 [Trichuris suis]
MSSRIAAQNKRKPVFEGFEAHGLPGILVDVGPPWHLLPEQGGFIAVVHLLWKVAFPAHQSSELMREGRRRLLIGRRCFSGHP